jgi:FKBP-type peptidyl-prolyl cis-trans isomerase
MKTILCAALVMMLGTAHAADDALGPAANSAFLADNAKKPGTVTRPSGLQYRILRGGFGRRPAPGDIVRLFYTIRLINGTVVDSTTPSLPASLAVDTITMRGLTEALQLMHEGDRWQVVAPTALAFGVKGQGTVVPPNQTLVFDITLVSAAPPQPGQALDENPFSVWSNGREAGGAITIHP